MLILRITTLCAMIAIGVFLFGLFSMQWLGKVDIQCFTDEWFNCKFVTVLS